MRCFLGILILLIPSLLEAQTLRGRIIDRDFDLVLPAVNIYNRTKNVFRQSDRGGNYSILASEGDTIFVSTSGYKQDTLIIKRRWLIDTVNIYMYRKYVRMSEVKISGMDVYQEDSISRAEEFEDVIEKGPTSTIRGGNAPSDGVGISISPFTYFSSSEKKKREFRKQFEKQEEAAYVDYRFSKVNVSRLTGLKGDSLQQFMLRYRPTYKFCRSANHEDMLRYVNEKFKEYMKRES
jgi:hypothetical protein